MNRLVVILIAIVVSIFGTPITGIIFLVYSWPEHANGKEAYAAYCRKHRRAC